MNPMQDFLNSDRNFYPASIWNDILRNLGRPRTPVPNQTMAERGGRLMEEKIYRLVHKITNKYSKRFTKWFYRKGYRWAAWLNPKTEEMEHGLQCPFWVKPLMVFFSPSVYFSVYFSDEHAAVFEKESEKP